MLHTSPLTRVGLGALFTEQHEKATSEREQGYSNGGPHSLKQLFSIGTQTQNSCLHLVNLDGETHRVTHPRLLLLF